VPVATVVRKGINHPMPLVQGSSQGGNALVVGFFDLLMGFFFGGGEYLEDWEWTNEGQSLHEM
jgi:hypothetical protein